MPEHRFLGARVHGLTPERLNGLIGSAIDAREQLIVGNHNLHSLYLVDCDPHMAEFNERADWLFVDGMGVVALGRLLGCPLRRCHRLTYVDWIEALCADAARSGWSMLHLGGRPGVGERAARILAARHPGLALESLPGHFDHRPGSADNDAVLAAIAAAAPQVLLVGMGMPLQERWVLENLERIDANVILNCGACMDYVAGVQPTPPRWAGRVGLEWMFRLAADPRRLGRRYLVEPWHVARLAIGELRRSSRSRNGEHGLRPVERTPATASGMRGRPRPTSGRSVDALPNLLVIGAPRCATTSLHRYLDHHPEIAMSALKELNFFSGGIEPAAGPALRDPADLALIPIRRGTWSKGLDWYKRQFDPASPVRGESSPSYTSPWYGRECAERIARLLPEPLLIYCVRDPVERAISHYARARSSGRERRPIDRALGPDGFYAHASRLALRVEPFIERFGQERILIVESEDLGDRRRATLREVYRFLGVDEAFWTEELERRWNPAGGGGWSRIARRIGPGGALAPFLRLPARRRPWWLYRLTRARTVDRAPEVSPATRERLAEALAPDAERLRELSGRRFAHWSV